MCVGVWLSVWSLCIWVVVGIPGRPRGAGSGCTQDAGFKPMGPWATFIPSWRTAIPSPPPPAPPSTGLPDRGSGPRVAAGCSLRRGMGTTCVGDTRAQRLAARAPGEDTAGDSALRSCPPSSPRLLHPNETARSLQCSPYVRGGPTPWAKCCSHTLTHGHSCSHVRTYLSTFVHRDKRLDLN